MVLNLISILIFRYLHKNVQLSPSMKTCFLILMNDDYQVFINLERLRVLELNKNRLVEIPGLTFDGLKNVRILKLKRNNLRYIWLVSIVTYWSMASLNL